MKFFRSLLIQLSVLFIATVLMANIAWAYEPEGYVYWKSNISTSQDTIALRYGNSSTWDGAMFSIDAACKKNAGCNNYNALELIDSTGSIEIIARCKCTTFPFDGSIYTANTYCNGLQINTLLCEPPTPGQMVNANNLGLPPCN